MCLKEDACLAVQPETRIQATYTRKNIALTVNELQNATYHLWQGQGQHEQVSWGDTTLQVDPPQDHGLREQLLLLSVFAASLGLIKFAVGAGQSVGRCAFMLADFRPSM